MTGAPLPHKTVDCETILEPARLADCHEPSASLLQWRGSLREHLGGRGGVSLRPVVVKQPCLQEFRELVPPRDRPDAQYLVRTLRVES